MESVTEVLAQHPFLAELDRRHLDQFVGLSSWKRYDAHQMIFNEGDPALRWFLICRGKVAIETALLGCSDLQIQTLGPGEVLGWSWLLPPYEYHYGARAVEATEAIVLDARAVRDLCEADHDLGYELMKRFAVVIVQRLAATRQRFLTFPDPTPEPEHSGPLAFRVCDE